MANLFMSAPSIIKKSYHTIRLRFLLWLPITLNPVFFPCLTQKKINPFYHLLSVLAKTYPGESAKWRALHDWCAPVLGMTVCFTSLVYLHDLWIWDADMFGMLHKIVYLPCFTVGTMECLVCLKKWRAWRSS